MKKFMNNAGFTLVELIVVIAILGILAAVAVPAYTGYINKANAAADTQVLSAANTALAAACTENGLAPADAKTYVTATSSDAGGDKGCTVTIAAVADSNTSETSEIEAKGALVAADFASYYGGSSVVFEYYNTVAAAPGINNDGTLAVSE